MGNEETNRKADKIKEMTLKKNYKNSKIDQRWEYT